MDLWKLMVADYEYGKSLSPEDRDRLIGEEMAKDKPVKGSDYERADWKDAVYPVRLIKSEEIENRFYRSEPWVDDRGNDRMADDPIEKTQFKLTFEVLEGEKKGDWLWAFAPHRFGHKADGTMFGVRAKVAHAMNPEWDIEEGIEEDNSDLVGGMLMAVVTPKADPQYAKVVAWLPMLEGDIAKYGEGDAPELDVKEQWRAVAAAYQANGTRDEVMAALGDPKDAAGAIGAFEAMSEDEKAGVLAVAEKSSGPDFVDDIPF